MSCDDRDMYACVHAKLTACRVLGSVLVLNSCRVLSTVLVLIGKPCVSEARSRPGYYDVPSKCMCMFVV